MTIDQCVRYSYADMTTFLHEGRVDQVTYEAFVLLWEISAFRYGISYAQALPMMDAVIMAWDYIRRSRYAQIAY